MPNNLNQGICLKVEGKQRKTERKKDKITFIDQNGDFLLRWEIFKTDLMGKTRINHEDKVQ